MNTIRKGYVSTTEGQVHYRRLAADGPAGHPPLVCLHPAPTSGLYFTTTMPLLAKSRDVVAPDYPGYGGSDALAEPPTIADYARAMQTVADDQSADAPVDILGFHTGCLVGVEMALTRPEQVRRLVLCDVPYFSPEAQAAMYEQMAKPFTITPELSCLEPAWQFNVASRIEDVPLPRAFELFAEKLRTGERDSLGFAAAFTYDCEARFSRLDADVVVIATQSGLLDATREAAGVINGANLVEAPEITTAVFESGAKAIAVHVLASLDA